MDQTLKIRTDATAAMGMARRLGVGKIRHLDTALLWVQDYVRRGEVALEKVLGVDNPADALTKYISAPEMIKHLARMNLFFEEGKPESAPQLTTAIAKEVIQHKRIFSLRHKAPEQVASVVSVACVQGASYGQSSETPACPVRTEREYPALGVVPPMN